ncbi:hypothetical protein HanXRQr2_Chr11g0476151 [Helianthus annuus]|uniref:Kelch-type beta propeller n=1 Tax=Helianthus annuus TaxID=4232 RepID=A0A251T8R7_HELAN|nr:hypothetical protein HanXRQr2_Chr11g0476151 [Helianthus annuus]
MCKCGSERSSSVRRKIHTYSVLGNLFEFLPLYFCEASILQRSQAQNYYCYNSIFRVEGGQSVTLVGSKLITSGGEHKHLILLNDVNSLDLETMIWNVAETTQVDLYNTLATSGIFMGIAIVLWTMYVWLCA